MYLGLGLGLSRTLNNSVSAESFNFETSLPNGWFVTRSGATATYRDSSGDLQQASANTERIDHDASGNPLGILIENSATNKVLGKNFNPTATTGFSITNGTLTIVDNTAELAAAGLDGICTNGDVYRATNTSGTSVLTLSDTVGNTNKHSYRIWAYATGGTASIDLIGSGSQTIAQDTAFTMYEVEDITPTATTRYLRGVITSGRSLYFILPHLEENSFLTSTILNESAGSTSTRNRDEVKYSNLDSASFWSQSAGGIVATVRLPAYGYAEQGFFGAVQDSDSGNNQIGVRSITGTGRVDGNFRVSGSDQSNENIGVPLTDDEFATGILWKSGEVTTFESHGMRFRRETGISNHTATLDTLYLGRYQKYFGYANLHVTNLYVLKGEAALSDAGSAFLSENDTGFAIGGQSNGEGASEIEGLFTNGGEVAAIGELDNYYTTGRNFISNMAIGGSALYARNNATNYWLENDATTAGPLLTNALETWNAVGASRLKGIIWNQGETDVAAESKATLKAGWLQVFTLMRASLGDIQIYLMPPARRSDNASADTFYQNWLDAYKELADENAYITMLPNTKVLALVDETGATDTVHVSDAGWSEYAPWISRQLASDDGQSVSGAIAGSTITGVSRSGTTVTVTLTHASGITDFTPATAIEGFVFKYGVSETEINISSAARTNATTITLTLDDLPLSGPETLEYCYGTGYNLDPAQLVRGNDSNTLPLQWYAGSL